MGNYNLYEQECKWHFAYLGEDAGDVGPNNAMSQTFATFPCAALVRESIQNSLDARNKNNSNPVKVCFEFREMDKSSYPNFFGLSKHAEECMKYFPDNKNALKIYSDIKSLLDNNYSIGYIRVSDYNTNGMTYISQNTNNPFYAFVRAAGVSVKPATKAGGSFGFGKGAFFVMSPLNTLIVSSMDSKGDCYFEGVARFCTHRMNGTKCDNMGFYDNNEGKPTCDPNRIPQPFKRTETGTSIGIMGVSKEVWESSVEELAKEVLRNFFIAIHNKKLQVVINGNAATDNDAIFIDSSNLDDVMKKYFDSTKDSRTKENYNPRPYYEALLHSDRIFTKNLPTLGQVQLFVKEFDENSTQVVLSRSLMMKVYKASYSIGTFNCVFLCDNDAGDKILCDMEDPEHDNWMAERCKKEEIETSYPTAKTAKQELDKFINDSLDELLGIDETDTLEVAGLDKYLPMDNGAGKGEKGNPFSGKPSGKYEKESASLTTKDDGIKKYNPNTKRKGQVAQIASGTFNKKKGGKTTGGTGGHNGGNGGTNTGAGDNFGDGVVVGENGSFKKVIDVDWRPIVSKKKGCTDIVVYIQEDAPSAEMVFTIGREIGNANTKDDVSIATTNKGRAEGLRLYDVELKKDAKNIIQISFSDHLAHSLSLTVYKKISDYETV